MMHTIVQTTMHRARQSCRLMEMPLTTISQINLGMILLGALDQEEAPQGLQQKVLDLVGDLHNLSTQAETVRNLAVSPPGQEPNLRGLEEIRLGLDRDQDQDRHNQEQDHHSLESLLRDLEEVQ